MKGILISYIAYDSFGKSCEISAFSAREALRDAIEMIGEVKTLVKKY